MKDMVDRKYWLTNQFEDLKQDIVADIQNYYKSANYLHIKDLPEYRNEYEIYHQHADYYLYGIIDKLIIDKEKLIIVDYKTDSISENEINDRANQYFTQLKFYSYIASKLFPRRYKVSASFSFFKAS